MGSKFGFGKIAAEWNDTKKAALEVMAVDAMAEFSENFAKQGSGKKKWKEVQRRIPGSGWYERGDSDDRTRPILQGKTGELEYNMQITHVDSRSASIVNDSPYAELQNEGGTNGRGYVVPARPFMVQTAQLTIEQLASLKLVTGKVWKVK